MHIQEQTHIEGRSTHTYTRKDHAYGSVHKHAHIQSHTHTHTHTHMKNINTLRRRIIDINKEAISIGTLRRCILIIKCSNQMFYGKC